MSDFIPQKFVLLSLLFNDELTFQQYNIVSKSIRSLWKKVKKLIFNINFVLPLIENIFIKKFHLTID